MNKLIVLNIDFTSKAGDKNFIHPVIIQSDKENILIDCGNLGFLPLLEKEAKKYNFDFSQLTKIIHIYKLLLHLWKNHILRERKNL